MSRTITLKNIPDDVYERLKVAAEVHRRSLNGEAIACLERVLMPQRVSAEERRDRARRVRATLEQERFDPDEIARSIRQGRA